MAAGIGAQNVSFPDYTEDLSEARKNAVRLFLSYAEDAVDYRDTHSFGLKALGYAADDDKDTVRKQIRAQTDSRIFVPKSRCNGCVFR